MLHEIILAIGLLLILEGLFPTISPKKYRDFMRKLSQQSEVGLRKMGLLLVIIGVIIVFVIKSQFGV